MKTKEIKVKLGVNSYQICIGSDILNDIGGRLKFLNIGKKCAIITNPLIGKLYGFKIIEGIEREGFETIMMEVPEGEEQKSLGTANDLYNRLFSYGLDRKSCIISLGGGVIGDLSGFVSATYMRGIPFIQVPTTLLSQVDSSVGGKVAVNHPNGKNLIGTFYQPKLVWIDIETLKTLSERELRSGLAEVIKYGVISDRNLFDYIRYNISKVKNLNRKTLMYLIAKSCTIKADIVEKDEKEKGLRSILNYGHTLGHALETITHYNKYRHGEAISIGMAFAAKLSNRLGMLSSEEMMRQVNLLHSVGLPTTIEDNINIDEILEVMSRDKKSIDGKLRFVLVEKIGKTMVKDDVPENILMNILEGIKE